jgi:hypothetical protein
MSPNEFHLVIETIDGWGHTVVSGRLSHHDHAVEFKFKFECDRLPEIVAEFAA